MRTRFITSGVREDAFPETGLAEVAFVGRSNVGKSSLLNALTGSKIARTSRTPGRTQMINFFEVHTGSITYMLADLPGRGYAVAPKAVRGGWGELISCYLERREPLTAVLFLLDLRRGADENDVALHGALEQALRRRRGTTLVVGTKSDKLTKAELKPALGRMAESLGLPREGIIATSSSTRVGLDPLRSAIEAAVRRAG